MKSKIVGAFTFCNESHLILHQIETMLLFCDEIIALSDDPSHLAFQIAKSYVKEGLFHLYFNVKSNNFLQRNEVGDRQNLLQHARNIGANIYFYTDVDEIIEHKSIEKIKQSLKHLKNNEILTLPRYDFWRNCYNYRLLRNESNAKKIFINEPSPYKTQYACRLNNALNFEFKCPPNFHAKRMPEFRVPMNEVILNDVRVLHYGYINDFLIEEKKNFYLTNSTISNVNWAEDMQVSTEEYKNKWGIGELERKHD